MAKNSLIHDISEQRLRGSADSSRFFKYSSKGRKFSEKGIAKILSDSERTGIFQTYYRGNKLLASFAIYQDNNDFFIPIQQVFFTRAPYSQLARDWLREQFWLYRKELEKDTTLYLLESERDMLDDLYRAGFFINSRVTQGCPKRALTGLVETYNPPMDLDHLGLEVRNLGMKDIEGICKISRAEFRKNPQFGWFVTSKTFQKQFRKSLLHQLSSKEGKETQLAVFTNRGKIVGHAGAYISPTPFYGLGAGADITLDSKIQGMGIVKTLYRRNLEVLVRRKVRIIRGGTAQPGMLKLNQIMGRKTHGYLMRNGKAFFPRAHFFQFDP